jgi:hypothetical protein
MKSRSLIFVFLSLALTACARPQPAPSAPPVIGWSWTAATGAQASWTTTLFTATVTSLTNACPPPGGTTYHSVGTVSGTATSYSDPNETAGSFICALTQNSTSTGCGTGGTSPCYSAYSPVSAVFAVPPLPTAPGVPTPTVTTAMLAPPKTEGPHEPTMAFGRYADPLTPILPAPKTAPQLAAR